VESTLAKTGAVPVPKIVVELVIWVGTPVVELIENRETLLAPLLAVYKNFPEGWIATETGLLVHVVVVLVQVVKGEPGIPVKAPLFASIARTDTVLAMKFATYRKCPDGSTARETGPTSTSTGELGTGCNAPELIE
jgi:hypothetical protein